MSRKMNWNGNEKIWLSHKNSEQISSENNWKGILYSCLWLKTAKSWFLTLNKQRNKFGHNTQQNKTNSIPWRKNVWANNKGKKRRSESSTAKQQRVENLKEKICFKNKKENILGLGWQPMHKHCHFILGKLKYIEMFMQKECMKIEASCKFWDVVFQ